MAATRAATKNRRRPGPTDDVSTAAPRRGRRADPRARRHTEGAAGWTKLVNADPTRKYVLVYLRSEDQGPDYYSSVGFVPEIWEDGGVRFHRGRTGVMGEEMVMRGHLLMSIPLRSDDPDEMTAESIEDYGPDGDTGQQRADEIEDMIIERAGGEDHLRGLLPRRYARAQNLTRNLEYED